MSLRDGTAKMSKSDPSDMSRINLTTTTTRSRRRSARRRPIAEPLPELGRGARRPARGAQPRHHLCALTDRTPQIGDRRNSPARASARSSRRSPTCWSRRWRRSARGSTQFEADPGRARRNPRRRARQGSGDGRADARRRLSRAWPAARSAEPRPVDFSTVQRNFARTASCSIFGIKPRPSRQGRLKGLSMSIQEADAARWPRRVAAGPERLRHRLSGPGLSASRRCPRRRARASSSSPPIRDKRGGLEFAAICRSRPPPPVAARLYRGAVARAPRRCVVTLDYGVDNGRERVAHLSRVRWRLRRLRLPAVLQPLRLFRPPSLALLLGLARSVLGRLVGYDDVRSYTVYTSYPRHGHPPHRRRPVAVRRHGPGALADRRAAGAGAEPGRGDVHRLPGQFGRDGADHGRAGARTAAE